MEKLFAKTIAVSLALSCLICQTGVCGPKITKVAKDPYISAVVLDADTGTVIFQDNTDKPAYPASMVKLMDMLIIMEKVEQGKAVLPSRDPHQDPVSVPDQPVPVDRLAHQTANLFFPERHNQNRFLKTLSPRPLRPFYYNR